jgi:lipopolysaccharide transport system ATP-binding protein
MSDDVVIKVENLSKLYRLGELHKQTGSFRDMVTNSFKCLWTQNKSKYYKSNRDNKYPITNNQSNNQSPITDNHSPAGEYIWALRDVSFEVKQREVLGIIGRNGAGKTTLLKILSRITKPTQGRASINGRVGSLLEVGTGFHPELTGRENIYLNGAILGMKKAEIDRKFDEIVAFAEIENFIDTPVKRYSSGMYVRLAFAVAAHLEPEILLVDEVLAVGDAAFQTKCLGKMGSVAQEGRTVLFVSHNMRAIQQLCQRGVLLNEGRLVADRQSHEVVEQYLQQNSAGTLTDIPTLIRQLPPDPDFRLHSISIRQNGLLTGGNIVNGKPVEVEINYEVLHKVLGFRVFFDLRDEYDDVLIRSYHDDDTDEIPAMLPGRYVSTAFIPANFLAPRQYKLIVKATIHKVRGCTADGITIPLRVVNSGRINRGYVNEYEYSSAKLAPIFEWHTILL